jgi:hypothetical protein
MLHNGMGRLEPIGISREKHRTGTQGLELDAAGLGGGAAALSRNSHGGDSRRRSSDLPGPFLGASQETRLDGVNRVHSLFSGTSQPGRRQGYES